MAHQAGSGPGGPESGWVARRGLALLTDLYELTMIGGYHRHGMHERRACFEYFFRGLPPDTGYAVLAGLEPFLAALEGLRFGREDLDYLAGRGIFADGFLEYLEDWRPRVDVSSPPEGTVVFPYEPVVQVSGPLLDVQLVETLLLNMLNYPTLVATKAARICGAAEGEPVIEFGLRRAQGPDGGLSGARAAYVGGCVGSSNVLAGKHYGVPVSGTMAHSWVMSFPSELESFRAYIEAYPEDPILLVDTYDTLKSGVPNAIRVFSEMREEGREQRFAIRLDSGDLAKLSKEAWRMITEAGFEDPLIVASNELEEDLIADLKRQGAKINAWGVGTHLITCRDHPALSGVYKLVAVEEDGEWKPRLKVTSNVAKTTDPAAKVVWRLTDPTGRPLADVLALEGEEPAGEGTYRGLDRESMTRPYNVDGVAGSEPLLRLMMEGGRRTEPPEALERIRERAGRQVSGLFDELTRLRNPAIYRVLLSPGLAGLKRTMIEQARNRHG
jgi:nicotinate phosphoribosyltransferase